MAGRVFRDWTHGLSEMKRKLKDRPSQRSVKVQDPEVARLPARFVADELRRLLRKR
jgi:hypothetical protein